MPHAIKISLPILAVALLLGTFGFVSAETLEVEARLDAAVKTDIRPRPLQLLHDKLELQKKAKMEIKELQEDAKDFRTGVRVDLKAASSGAEKRDVLKDAKTERGELKQERMEIKADLKDRLQTLMRTHLGTSVVRLNTALRHFDSLISRIESRIDKLKERGVETASVETSLATAVTLTATAQADTQALTDLIKSVTDASDPATIKAQLRAAIDKATASIKTAHQALLKTARELSALVPRIKAGAETTTTADVNN